jgi:hypothetical protein
MMKPVSPLAVVAIPVKDEAERLPACLDALARQTGTRLPAVLLLLNNCTDDSANVARRFDAGSNLAVHVEEIHLPPGQAGAGVARGLAMERAACLVDPTGVLLTTDADSMVPQDWVAANLRALWTVDAVAGRAVISAEESRLIPQRLHDDDARECAYAALLDEATSLLDPDAFDPWPRHTEESGASIAVRLDAYRRAGGIPPVRLGEDREFFNALRAIDARIRHAPEIAVTVSGRIVGRAEGGMADTIRRRLVQPDPHIDDRLEPAVTAVRRARLRAITRKAFAGSPAPGLPRELRLSADAVRGALDASSFGRAWLRIAALSPVLCRVRVPVQALARETRRAHDLVADLRARGSKVQILVAQPIRVAQAMADANFNTAAPGPERSPSPPPVRPAISPSSARISRKSVDSPPEQYSPNAG